MTDEQRNAVWNVLTGRLFNDREFCYATPQGPPGWREFSFRFWDEILRKCADERPGTLGEALYVVREYFLHGEWYEAVDVLEFAISFSPDLAKPINAALEREFSAYRLVNGRATEVTSDEEFVLMDESLQADDFPTIRAHLRQAHEHLTRRQDPDYRNSMKESISAVEGMARVVMGSAGTLGDLLKVLERERGLHPSLAKAFSKLYGYTNDAEGIRHAMSDQPKLGPADAKFFMLICMSFVNYLKTMLPAAE